MISIESISIMNPVITQDNNQLRCTTEQQMSDLVIRRFITLIGVVTG